MVLIVLPPPQAHFSDVKHEKMFSLNQSMLTSNSSLNLYEKEFQFDKVLARNFDTDTHDTQKFDHFVCLFLGTLLHFCFEVNRALLIEFHRHLQIF